MGQNSEIIIYTDLDGTTKLQIQLEDETVWLTQEQMAILFGKARTTVTEHIGNIFKEGELNEKEVCRLFRHTTKHGAIEDKTQSKQVKSYNLDVIISVGYRVKSPQGTKFRQWATKRIHEYIYLDFAELQATNGRLMKMQDWIQKLDDFLRISEKELLTNIGKVSHKKVVEKANFC